MKLKAYQPDVASVKQHFINMADGKHVRKQYGYGGSRLGPKLRSGGYTSMKRINNIDPSVVNLVTPTAMALEQAKSKLKHSPTKRVIKKRGKTSKTISKKPKRVKKSGKTIKRKKIKRKKSVKRNQLQKKRRSDNFF